MQFQDISSINLIYIKNTTHSASMVYIEQFGKSIYKINLPNCYKSVEKLLSLTPYNHWDLGVQFIELDYIHQLNNQYRFKDKPTDILSFSFHQAIVPGQLPQVTNEDEKNIGDLFICLDYVHNQFKSIQIQNDHGKNNSTKLNIKDQLEERLPVLFTHGISHLLGFDHELDEDFIKMNEYEQEILKAYRLWEKSQTNFNLLE